MLTENQVIMYILKSATQIGKTHTEKSNDCTSNDLYPTVAIMIFQDYDVANKGYEYSFKTN